MMSVFFCEYGIQNTIFSDENKSLKLIKLSQRKKKMLLDDLQFGIGENAG